VDVVPSGPNWTPPPPPPHYTSFKGNILQDVKKDLFMVSGFIPVTTESLDRLDRECKTLYDGVLETLHINCTNIVFLDIIHRPVFI
jgi:hypothetical protein